MLDLPKWLKDILSELKCPGCKKDLQPEAINAEGIRKSAVYKNKTAYFIEYHCPFCKQSSTLELNAMTVEDWVMQMFDQYASGEYSKKYDEKDDSKNDKDAPKAISELNKRTDRKTKISDEEFQEAIRFINGCKTHEEFLFGIGLDQSQIDEINKQDTESKNKKGTKRNSSKESNETDK